MERNIEHAYSYEDMELLLKLFHKTIDGFHFVEAAKATYNGSDEKDLWLIWDSFKVMYNE